jgi:DNA-binding NarL/FixJ family response regulator
MRFALFEVKRFCRFTLGTRHFAESPSGCFNSCRTPADQSRYIHHLIAGGPMRYNNAADVLPRRLLRAVQAYAGGELLYIPADAETKSQWGSRNGARKHYTERNAEIRMRRQNGESFQALADTYGLSEDSIRKIVRQPVNKPKGASV